MERKILVISPSCSSSSAERLAYGLKGLYHNQTENPQTDFSDCSRIFNYGCGGDITHNKIINLPLSVRRAINKISTFKRTTPFCSTVEWTKSKEIAAGWFKEDGLVVARQKLKSNQGKGLIYCETQQVFNDTEAKMWTRFFPHVAEVRINVYRGVILSVYEKKAGKEHTLFSHLELVGEHPDVTLMIETIGANINLDFYGMDVLVNGSGVCKLLEINSAPILHEETEDKLIPLIRRDFK